MALIHPPVPTRTPTPQCLGRDHDRWRGGPGPANPAGPRPQPGAAVPDLVPRPPAPGKPGWPASPRARTGRTGGGSSPPHPSFLKTGPGGQQSYCSPKPPPVCPRPMSWHREPTGQCPTVNGADPVGIVPFKPNRATELHLARATRRGSLPSSLTELLMKPRAPCNSLF